MDSELKTNILLAEYAEAGTICRAYEELTRKTMSISIPALTALCGYIQINKISDSTLALLSIAGIIFCLLGINTIMRQKAYYYAYITRAKEIENILGMKLYNAGDNTKKPCCTFSNKLALCAALWIFVLYFFIILIKAFSCGL